jgi:hypothetical protein
MLGNNVAQSTPFHVVSDTAIATGSVVLPLWIYQASAVAGVITAFLGLILVSIRLLCAIRDWNRGEQNGK